MLQILLDKFDAAIPAFEFEYKRSLGTNHATKTFTPPNIKYSLQSIITHNPFSSTDNGRCLRF